MPRNHTKDLINALIEDNKPVKKLMPVWAMLIFIISLSFFYCFSCITALYGFRDDLLIALQSTLIQADMTLAIILAAITLSFALRSAIPGKAHLAKVGTYIGLFGIALLVTLHTAMGNWQVDWQSFIPNAHCFIDVALFSALPIAFTFYMIKKAAPTDLKNTGRLAVLSTMFIGYAATRLSCTVDESTHSFLTHIIPLILFGTFGSILGNRILRW